jgi:hypothetical protein
LKGALANRLRIATMYNIREYVVAGGLISYGPSLTEVHRQMGTYVAKGFEGGKVVEDYFSFELASRAKRNALKRYIFFTAASRRA